MDALRKRAIEVLEMGAVEIGPRGGAEMTALADRLRRGVPFLPMDGNAETTLRKGIAQVLSGCAGIQEGVAALPAVSSVSVLSLSVAEETLRRLGEARDALREAVTYGQVDEALRGSWSSAEITSAREGLRRAMRTDILERRVRETLMWAQTLHRPNSRLREELAEAERPLESGGGDEWFERAMALLSGQKEIGGDLAVAIEALEREIGRPGTMPGLR